MIKIIFYYAKKILFLAYIQLKFFLKDYKQKQSKLIMIRLIVNCKNNVIFKQQESFSTLNLLTNCLGSQQNGEIYNNKKFNQNIRNRYLNNLNSNYQIKRLCFSPICHFSRKKKQNLQKKFDSSLNKQFLKQKYKNNVSWQKRLWRYGAINFLPLFGFMIFFYIIKAHITKKESEMKQQNSHFNKISQRKNVNVLPEVRIRELLIAGDVMNLQVSILRKNRMKGSQQYTTFCFVKSAQGAQCASQIKNMTQFLMFLQNLPQDYKVSFQYQSYLQKVNESPFISKVINGALIIGILVFARHLYKKIGEIMKNSGGQSMFDIDTKKIQAIKPQNISTLFKDVAGMHEAKFQITQFVQFLKQPEKYIQMGAKIPKGALLTGPPGTGKTLLARACAGQAGVPFYYVSGSDFVEKYVGLGASRVRKLFDQAEKNAPSIIFIDQIDAIGKKRQSGPFANEQRDNTLNQLLVRMDGFDSTNKVIVMGATNIKQTLDPALLRPGRFDRSVQIGLPNYEQRKQILQVHLKKVKFDSKFTIQQLSNRVSILTPGFSGAQLANVCNEAAILAARQGAQMIDMVKFQKATQRVMAGLQKRNLFSPQEKVMLAYYECGKAVVGWFTEGSDPIIKLSILPFSKASKGYSHTIKDQIGLTTKQELLGKICFYLAGRASQNYFQQYVTTNGDSDLKRAKRIISLLVTKFGMTQKLHHIAFPDIEFVRKPYSSQIQTTIDQQIERITAQCKLKVESLIIEKKDLIQKLKIALLQKETLNHKELKQILGERPFEQTNQNYKKYIVQQQKAHQIKQKVIEGDQKLQDAPKIQNQ